MFRPARKFLPPYKKPPFFRQYDGKTEALPGKGAGCARNLLRQPCAASEFHLVMKLDGYSEMLFRHELGHGMNAQFKSLYFAEKVAASGWKP